MAESLPRADQTTRFEPLDWLRGLLAASIMVYHLVSWELAAPKADTLLSRLGAYGVSMFFVPSGLSIAIAYHRQLGSAAGIGSFAVRRVFRIWPLLWLAVLSLTLILQARDDAPSWRFIALNLTTLFGFVQPTGYLNAGAWSIGNEMVYYALTPLIVALYNRDVRWGNLLLAITLAIGAVFAFRLLDTSATLASQWGTYVNPFNNLFLYTAGVAVFYNATGPAWPRVAALGAIAVSMTVFVFYPASGDQITIVTGANRFVFSAASVLLVLGFFKSGFSLGRLLGTPLLQLGLATYGVYLLHPIVRELVRLAAPDLAPTAVIALTIALTLLVSWFLYHRFELPMMKLGKHFAAGDVRPLSHAR